MTTKITFISDMHGEYPDLPGGDLLILAGDYTGSDKLVQWHAFFKWLEYQPYRKKVMIAGNHDNFCKKWAISGTFAESEYEWMYPNDKPVAEYLCDSGYEFEGIKMWGSPWTKTFEGINPHCTAFTLTDEEMLEKFKLIPDDLDILICHSPAYLLLDENKRAEHCGSFSLYEELNRAKPKIFVCAHIHENGGKCGILKSSKGWDILAINASYMDADYVSYNKIINIEYENNTKEWKILD